jgi:serine/threonine protein phosphatase 1
MGKYFAIGDIHGCLGKLRRLVEKIPFDPENDICIFLGDYIDRGPDSYGVVSFLIDFKKKFERTIFLKGNHEQMFEWYLAGESRQMFLVNGGKETVQDYHRHCESKSPLVLPPSHVSFYRSLRLYFESDDHIFVHAGLKESVPLESQVPEDLLWIRRNFIVSKHDFGKRVIFGHTPFTNPYIQPNKIGIDTGAVYGNKLTCLQLPEIVFYHS